MKISIYCNGGYKGFTRDIDEHCPITVDATPNDEGFDGYHVKVADLVALGVYDIDKGQKSDGGINSFQGYDFNPDKGTLYFMEHEATEIKPGNVKIIIVNDGGYPFRSAHNRTFPVVVDGYYDGSDLVEINHLDAKAIGMYVSNGQSVRFCLQGHPYGAEAHILK